MIVVCVLFIFALSGLYVYDAIRYEKNRRSLIEMIGALQADNRALMESLAASVDKPLIFTPIKMEESEGYFDRQQAPIPEEQPIRQY
jgi:hypothetical protein